MDFVKLGTDNASFRGNGLALADHYSWQQPVYATAGGKVVYVCFDMPDMTPGALPDPRMFRDDIRRTLGNAVAISHGNGEFSYYAHLEQASIQVNQGQMVRRGDLIARVGNSGRSPGPNLHFQVMNGPNPYFDQGLPMQFSHFSAGGQFFEQPMTIPTRMIVIGPSDSR
jgi:murein DD-endopeptidase MepM/ murein hydrolase activator NlpD